MKKQISAQFYFHSFSTLQVFPSVHVHSYFEYSKDTQLMYPFLSFLESELVFRTVNWFLYDMDISMFCNPSHTSLNISIITYLSTHCALAKAQRTFQMVWLSGEAGKVPHTLKSWLLGGFKRTSKAIINNVYIGT